MNLAPTQVRPATREDLAALPPTWRGEVLDGELYAFPGPGGPHADIELRRPRSPLTVPARPRRTGWMVDSDRAGDSTASRT